MLKFFHMFEITLIVKIFLSPFSENLVGLERKKGVHIILIKPKRKGKRATIRGTIFEKLLLLFFLVITKNYFLMMV